MATDTVAAAHVRSAPSEAAPLVAELMFRPKGTDIPPSGWRWVQYHAGWIRLSPWRSDRSAAERQGSTKPATSRTRRCFASTLLVLAIAGCSSIGPTVMLQDRSDYLSSIAESWKEQTLLNIVRARYGDAPSFLDVSSVISAYSLAGQLSAGAVVNSNLTSAVPYSSGAVGATVGYADRPTISYTPIGGDKFTKSFLRPIPPAGIFELIQAGYAADFVLRVTVRALNGVKNQSASGGQGEPADPAFYPLLEALRRLQLSQMVSLRVEKRGGGDVGLLILGSNRTPQVDQDLKFVMDTLHLKPGKDGELTIVFGAVQRNNTELVVLSRSMAEILNELAWGIEVPPEHVAEGRTLPSIRLASATDPSDRPLVRVLSGPTAPADAFTAVHYRGTWYWISDRDFASKRVYTLLMIFFQLAETGATPQVPSLTIPVQ